MSKATKIICLVAAAMVALGLVLTGIGYALGGSPHSMIGPWSHYDNLSDEELFSLPEMQHDSQDVEAFTSADLDVAYQVIEFRRGDTFHVDSVYNPKYSRMSISVVNGVLTVTEQRTARYKNQDNWLFYMNRIERTKGKLVITYPEEMNWADIKIQTDLGDLNMENMTIGRLEMLASMGEVELTGISAQAINIQANMGDIVIEDSQCDTSELTCDMGAIEVDGIQVRQSFSADASMGDIGIEGDLRGEIDVNCHMGSVEMGLYGEKSEYTIDASVSMGSLEVQGESGGGFGDHLRTGSGPNSLKISNDMGDIELSFSR